MLAKSNNWYVITGGPSSGKTTLLAELEKLGHITVPEAARTYIDREIAKGFSIEQIRKDEKKFQEEVAKLKIEIESLHPKDVLTFFDRGMHDSLAYMRHYAYELDDWIKAALDNASYQKVFLLDPLPVFEQDYARTEDEAFTGTITDLLHASYADAGMKPIKVPVLPVGARAQFILEKIKQD